MLPVIDRCSNDSDSYARPTIPISGRYRSLVISISLVDRTSDRLRVWDVQIDRRGTTNGCNAADELVCSGRPRIPGMVPCRISSSSVSPLANEVYQGSGIGISSRHATADCPMTRRVRLYSPARGSRGGDGDPLSTFRTRTRGSATSTSPSPPKTTTRTTPSSAPSRRRPRSRSPPASTRSRAARARAGSCWRSRPETRRRKKTGAESALRPS